MVNVLKWNLLLALVFVKKAWCWELTLLHTNDMHARLDGTTESNGVCTQLQRCLGGYSRVKYFADWAKRYYKNVVFLNAGDNFQGTTYYSLFKWKVIQEFVDAMGFDAMCLGNHEFDDGLNNLVPYLKRVTTPWVCSNINSQKEDGFADVSIRPWLFIEVEGRKVAVVGYLTPDTKEMADIGNLTILDEVESVRKSAREAKRQGADIVIGLGHSGWDMDHQVANRIPELDLVVGGHSHTFHYNGEPLGKEKPITTYPSIVFQARGKIVPVVQAYAFSKYVGLLHLKFDDDNRLMSAIGNPVLMDDTIPKDEHLEKILNKWKGKAKRLVSEEIGKTYVDLSNDQCRMEECNLGNLVTDAAVQYRMRQYEKSESKCLTDTLIAVINAGGLRASINPSANNGIITVGDLLTALPFHDKVVKVTVNGSVFRQLLEHSVQQYDTSAHSQGYPQFLHFSGVKVVYNVTEPPGRRVTCAQVRTDPCRMERNLTSLTDDMQLTFLTTRFLSRGGDGYSMLTTAAITDTGNASYYEMVKDYIRRNSSLTAGLQHRILVQH